ncbi:hypothetical protein CY0110_15617 [Crocosphaera chwakensis CCY0110]|uniref:Uncharacterized protein n=1 Tax=Crocosphaera chwakensis CCY0110 TaxID=391612 RepID=A3IHF5_9CHRO|nr:hypothetical protein CY0110_15617 [Crocosphaera chwakensis CCY0110]
MGAYRVLAIALRRYLLIHQTERCWLCHLDG